MLSFEELNEKNVRRCRDAFHLIDAWSPSDWMTCAVGELGEAANIIKKVKRGDYALEDAREAIGFEIADTIIYLDLLAQRLGINLAESVRKKFNIVSDRVGSPEKL